METVCVQEVLAFLVAFDPAFGAAHALPGDAPQQTLTLMTVGGCRGRPHLEIMGRGGGDGIDQRLQGFSEHVQFL